MIVAILVLSVILTVIGIIKIAYGGIKKEDDIIWTVVSILSGIIIILSTAIL